MLIAWRSGCLTGSDMSSKRLCIGGGVYVPAVLSLVTIGYLLSAMQLGPPMKDGNMTASFFPMLAAVIMLIALACVIVQEVRRSRSNDVKRPDGEAVEEDAGQVSKSYGGISLGAIRVVLLTAGYLLAFDLVGYFVSTFLYVLLLMFQFGSGSLKNWSMKLFATLSITGAGYLLFEVFFQVRLPTLWS
ncbi:tripartite tricarboxylate transporter TctB family protein [Halomonas organivorans]|uniref:Putative tricarboxylic transport membrane protein n=1 Tax=Halomonas organivorans TaxID=257772 RepID=A0A7W5BZB4_9GAMM|nr:tripartite tricarboxylate transporter TctB family protein [Halomonas organivorans]MBB3141940.1 putative tricarboxylic transport membrane protein [Halomonas organivorans]